jgi:hypothetical protein
LATFLFKKIFYKLKLGLYFGRIFEDIGHFIHPVILPPQRNQGPIFCTFFSCKVIFSGIFLRISWGNDFSKRKFKFSPTCLRGKISAEFSPKFPRKKCTKNRPLDDELTGVCLEFEVARNLLLPEHLPRPQVAFVQPEDGAAAGLQADLALRAVGRTNVVQVERPVPVVGPQRHWL